LSHWRWCAANLCLHQTSIFLVSVHVVYTSFSFSTKNNSWLLVPIGLKDQQENCVGGNKTLLWPEETFACCCAEPPFVAHVKKDPWQPNPKNWLFDVPFEKTSASSKIEFASADESWGRQMTATNENEKQICQCQHHCLQTTAMLKCQHQHMPWGLLTTQICPGTKFKSTLGSASNLNPPLDQIQINPEVHCSSNSPGGRTQIHPGVGLKSTMGSNSNPPQGPTQINPGVCLKFAPGSNWNPPWGPTQFSPGVWPKSTVGSNSNPPWGPMQIHSTLDEAEAKGCNNKSHQIKSLQQKLRNHEDCQQVAVLTNSFRTVSKSTAANG